MVTSELLANRVLTESSRFKGQGMFFCSSSEPASRREPLGERAQPRAPRFWPVALEWRYPGDHHDALATAHVWLPLTLLSLFQLCWWFRPFYDVTSEIFFATDLDLWSSLILKTATVTSRLWRCLSLCSQPPTFVCLVHHQIIFFFLDDLMRRSDPGETSVRKKRFRLFSSPWYQENVKGVFRGEHLKRATVSQNEQTTSVWVWMCVI